MAASKGEKDKEIRLQKNFLKNQQVFFALFHKDDFCSRLVGLSMKYFPTDSPEKKLNHITAGFSFCFEHRLQIRELSKDSVAMLAPETQINFNMAVHKFLKDYHLGSEWMSTVIDFVALGFIVPPILNLGLSQEVIMPKKSELKSRGWMQRARATLILNPDTTLGDIQDAWDAIKKHQKASWPGYKGYKFSPKTIIRDSKIFEIDRAKKEVPDDKKYSIDLSQIEKMWIKKYGLKKAEKMIRDSRRNDGRKLRGRLKIKKEITDEEYAKQVFGLKGAAAKRMAATLRQQRHRSKNVTPFLD